MKKIWILVLAALAGCDTQPLAVRIRQNTQHIPQAYHFYVLGDWGEDGDCRQKETAYAMQAATHSIAPDIIISTGDNFYPKGVKNTQDPRWQSTYEQVYHGEGLYVPWHVVLGNHDHQGHIDAQINYTSLSKRWNLPSTYYTKTARTKEGARIRFVYLDTTPFAKGYHRDPKYPHISAQDTTQQKIWMDKVLADPHADWKIVIGHHPFYAGGKKKHNTRMESIRKSLEPLLEKHQVDAYFAGHEHSLQHLYTGSVHYFISGAGSHVHRSGHTPYTQFHAAIQGFMIGSVTKHSLLVQVLSYTGERLYRTEIHKP